MAWRVWTWNHLPALGLKGRSTVAAVESGAKSRLQARVEQVKHENDGRTRMDWKHYMD